MNNLTKRIKYKGIVFFIFLFLLCTHQLVLGQSSESSNWMFGMGSGEKGAQLDFSTSAPSARAITGTVDLFSANLSMSNQAGELIFYSNGCFVSNANHQMMPGSENLTPGFTQDAQCPHGSPFSESMITLPSTEEVNIYYVFQTINHTSYTSPKDPTVLSTTPFNLVYSTIDMTLDNGLGVMTQKHVPILTDTFSNNGFQAIKHANGIDWWLILPEYGTNCYYSILFSKGKFKIQTKQCIGFEWGLIDMGNQSAVSLDGTKYARFTTTLGITFLEFDRCTGRFFNARHFAKKIVPYRVGGIAFSPNGDLLYVSTLLEIYQFDLNATNIEESKLLVAEYDGVSNPTATNFFRAATGSDGKIYWCTYRNTYNLHVINQPNKRGESCDFVHRAITLPEMNGGSIPSFPNYRLESLATPCDIVIAPDKISDIFPYPNPAQKSITISGTVKEGYRFELYDFLGNRVYTNTIQHWQQQFNLPADLNSGIYSYRIVAGNTYIKTGKLYLQD